MTLVFAELLSFILESVTFVAEMAIALGSLVAQMVKKSLAYLQCSPNTYVTQQLGRIL